MAVDSLLASRLQAILRARGITNVGPFDFVVMVADGKQELKAWDVAKLGPQPTPAEIAAVTDDTASTEVKVRRRDQGLWTPQMVALVRALNARLRAANVDNVTVGTFRAAIEAEYDLLVN